MRRFVVTWIILMVLAVSVPVYGEEAREEESGRLYGAASVLVMDAVSGAVLYETEGFVRRYPASITKIMTALLVLEMVEDLDEWVVFSENAVYLPHYAGRMDIEAGERMTVLQALYGLMLPSANDIARALAEHVSGSIDEFVAQMNIRAEELGALNTRFINPCGLPGDGQFVTAHDIALIKRAAIQNPLYVEIVSTPYFDLPPSEFYEDVRQMRNSNLMIRPTNENFNPHVIGGKTGFTNAAQHTLVTYAARDGVELIISVLYASPRNMIFSDTAALMNFIFYGPTQEIDENENIDLPDPSAAQAVPVFLTDPSDSLMTGDFLPQEQYEFSHAHMNMTSEISTSQAATSASMAVAIVGAALILIIIIRHRILR